MNTEAILIKPKNKKEQDFALDLVKKLNFPFELQDANPVSIKAKARKEDDILEKYKGYPLVKDLKQGLQEGKDHINGKKKLKRYQSV